MLASLCTLYKSKRRYKSLCIQSALHVKSLHHDSSQVNPDCCLNLGLFHLHGHWSRNLHGARKALHCKRRVLLRAAMSRMATRYLQLKLMATNCRFKLCKNWFACTRMDKDMWRAYLQLSKTLSLGAPYAPCPSVAGI